MDDHEVAPWLSLLASVVIRAIRDAKAGDMLAAHWLWQTLPEAAAAHQIPRPGASGNEPQPSSG